MKNAPVPQTKNEDSVTFIGTMTSQPAPVGLVASLLCRKLELLRENCFRDAEYGDQAGAIGKINSLILQPLNQELQRRRKPLQFLSAVPCRERHNRVHIKFKHRDATCSVAFLLFPPSTRQQARENDPEAEKSAPRRGGAKVKTKKKKGKSKGTWE